LARASLYLDDDQAKAVDLLDDARLACPHTAINEAATRREIPILLKTGNAPRALMLTVSYIREFGKSIYARKLFRDLSEEIAKHADLDSAAPVDRLVDALDDKDMQPASELFVDMAAEAILQGRLKLANAAANRVLKTSGASPENQERAQLYAAASEAPSDNAASAMKALDQIAADRLSEDDTEIREVAGFIAKAVTGGESVNRDFAAVSTPTNIPQGSSARKAMKALGDADAALKEADSLISGSGR
jgi:chemotaxis protein MotC